MVLITDYDLMYSGAFLILYFYSYAGVQDDQLGAVFNGLENGGATGGAPLVMEGAPPLWLEGAAAA